MKRVIERLFIAEFWMFTIVGIGMLILAGLGFQLAAAGVPKNAEAIIATLVTGILLVMRDAITAIRARWRIDQAPETTETEEQP